ncbi:MAG TPA: wax ester/triacylglycerol synthase family O-acyltransferase [Bryobacteraceae bacterium]|nr:wax ester/triacylglycerol synthase family O-acyltransferase [Bryobacteraceae bacterium]
MKPPILNRRMSATDAAFLYLERREIPLHIAGICVFESTIPFAEFVAAIDRKLNLLPRYRQVVADPAFHLGYPTWEDDPAFDIRRHIFHVTVEPPGGQAELEALASRILSQVMDRGKPLWDIHVIDGLAEGRGAILARVHHALADGIAGASLMKIILDSDPAPGKPGKKPRFRPRPAAANGSLADTLASAVRSSLESMIAAEAVLMDFGQSLFDARTQEALQKLLALLPEFAAASERFPFNKPCSGERKFCWTEFPLDDICNIRTNAGGTANDVVLAVITRAVARYIELHGERVKGRFLRVVCPVSMRHGDGGESLGNQISFLPVALPLDVKNPVEMLRAVATRTEIMKNARVAHLVALMGTWLGAAPPPLQALFWGTVPQVPLPLPLFNMICTNIPGSKVPLYALGRKMIAFYPHVPTGYELGVNCAVQSYDGRVFCGLTADARVVPDAGRLRDFIQKAFLDLRRAAGVRPPRRKSKPAIEPRPAAVNGSAAAD